MQFEWAGKRLCIRIGWPGLRSNSKSLPSIPPRTGHPENLSRFQVWPPVASIRTARNALEPTERWRVTRESENACRRDEQVTRHESPTKCLRRVNISTRRLVELLVLPQ